MKTAWMFPGQGSQAPGMARKLLAEFPVAKEILDEASQQSGHDLNRVRMFGPDARLMDPEITEPLLAATQIAYATVLLDQDIRPDTVAGYSAGEVAAYFAAGVLSRKDAIQVAVIRGKVLQAFIDETTAMIAVAKIDANEINQRLAAYSHVEVAACNAPNHVTLVGNRKEITSLTAELVRTGANVTEVSVAGPWHSRTIATASEKIYAQIQNLNFQTPNVPLFTSARGLQERKPSTLALRLAEQVSTAVCWQTIVENWKALEINTLVEVGAGRVLMGLLRHNWPEYEAYKVECVESASGSIAVLHRLLTARSTGS